MTRPGRNDACPCGSGKKYKRCCLGKEEARAEFASELQRDALPLLRELGRYASERSGSAPQTIAAERFPFWRPPADRIKTARLLDYLIFDHRVQHGITAVEEYLGQRGPLITQAQRKLLEAWQSRGIRLYMLEGWSGGFACCSASLPDDGARIEVAPLERSDSTIKPGSPIALRALPVGPAFLFPSWPISFGNRTAADVAASIVARHHAYVRTQRIVALDDFLRLESTVFDEEAAAALASPIIVPGRA